MRKTFFISVTVFCGLLFAFAILAMSSHSNGTLSSKAQTRRSVATVTTSRTTSTVVATGATPAVATTASGALSWPAGTLELGMLSPPGQAATESASVPFGFRYQYLAGGVNTSDNWENYGNGNGTYVSQYVQESESVQAIPVFSYYEIRQSLPGANDSNEQTADLTNLDDTATMTAYYRNLIEFFQQAAIYATPVVLQMEPDLWGYIEQESPDPSDIPAAVADTHISTLRGLPNTAQGFSRAIIRLRNEYAPQVRVAYSDSIWGTGKAIQQSHPSTAEVTVMAAESLAFYRALDTKFDAFFTEMSDRDAGYAQNVDGDGVSQWWNATDFAHLGQYIAEVHAKLLLPVAIWQIPVGNTFYRVMDNRPYHYQDNKVQSLLGSNAVARKLLRSYRAAGVDLLLFGSGQSTDTCACDNGPVQNSLPAPFDGNNKTALSSDDDGGYFLHQARLYYNDPLRIAAN
jgi:hypothetical protein